MFYSVPWTSSLTFTYIVSDQVVISTACLFLLQSGHFIYMAGMAGQHFIPSSLPLRLAKWFSEKNLKLSSRSLKWYYTNPRGWDPGFEFWPAIPAPIYKEWDLTCFLFLFEDIIQCVWLPNVYEQITIGINLRLNKTLTSNKIKICSIPFIVISYIDTSCFRSSGLFNHVFFPIVISSLFLYRARMVRKDSIPPSQPLQLP